MILVNHRKLENLKGIMWLLRGGACRFINPFVDQNFFHLPRTVLRGISMTSNTLVNNGTFPLNYEMFLKSPKDFYYLETWDIIQEYKFRCFTLAISLGCCSVGQGWVGTWVTCWWCQRHSVALVVSAHTEASLLMLGMCKVGTDWDGQRSNSATYRNLTYI